MIKVTELRKIYSAQGVKGFGSANRETFNADIEAAWDAAIVEDAARKPVAPVAAPAPKKGKCDVCGKRRASKDNNGMCEPCYEEGAWENTHSDENHEELISSGVTRTAEENASIKGCWICHPELNRAQREVREGRSRMGMEIVAKGTEIHKSNTFKIAAEAAGWTVTIHTETYEGGNVRHYADAKRGDDAIQLAWDGRAYDYPASSAHFGGKARKVRNLKEALRLL